MSLNRLSKWALASFVALTLGVANPLVQAGESKVAQQHPSKGKDDGTTVSKSIGKVPSKDDGTTEVKSTTKDKTEVISETPKVEKRLHKGTTRVSLTSKSTIKGKSLGHPESKLIAKVKGKDSVKSSLKDKTTVTTTEKMPKAEDGETTPTVKKEVE